MGLIENGLKDKVAVVTGGASGIGQAIANAFAAAGTSVLIADLNESGARRAAETLRGAGRTAWALQVDVASEAAVENLFREVARLAGGVDVLVNAAAWMHPERYKPLLGQPIEEFDRTMAVNFRGAYLCCRAALPTLESRGGNVVNITSVGASVAFADAAAYNASKAALEHFTRALALEYARRHVRVNAVAPGWIETEGATFGEGYREQLASNVDRLIPLNRLGRPEEIAPAVLFLASDTAASYVTGSTITVDGGWVLR